MLPGRASRSYGLPRRALKLVPRLTYEHEVPYPRPAVFDIVADVERYPEFLPGWRWARIIDRRGRALTVEQEIGAAGLTWRFRTTAVLQRPEIITVETREAPFEHMHERWRFEAAGDSRTRVTFEVDYALRGVMLRSLASRLFDGGFRDTFEAFRRRIDALLG